MTVVLLGDLTWIRIVGMKENLEGWDGGWEGGSRGRELILVVIWQKSI